MDFGIFLQVVYWIIIFLDGVTSTVTVKDLSGRNTVSIKGTLSLMCTISPLETYVFWSTPATGFGTACYCSNTEDKCILALNDDRYTCSSNFSLGQITLTVTNVSLTDGGSYRCRHATNPPEINTLNITVHGNVTVADISGRNAVSINGILTLKCSVSPLESYVFWETPAAAGGLICYCLHTEDSCLTESFDGNRTSCSSEVFRGHFVLRIKKINIGDEGIYRCRHQVPNRQEWDTLFISVQVPITFVEMVNLVATNATVIENVTSEFVCETSTGRPQATIQWNKRLNNNTEVVIPGGSISTVPSEPGVITRSTLQYTPSRSDHDYKIYCTAYNIDSSDTFVSITQPQLYVQYPPRNPLIRYGTRDGPEIISNIAVVRGDTFSVYCIVSSDPPSAYKWSGHTTYSDKLTVSKVKMDSSWTCTATNEMRSSEGVEKTGSASADILVSVAYGPSIPFFTYHTTTAGQVSVESSLNVLQGISLKVTCNGSDSYPDAFYFWTTQNGQVISDTGTLAVDSVNKDQTSFICVVQNLMNRSFGREETGRNSATLTLNILYSPTTRPLTDEILRETQPLSKTCVASHGNPQNTKFRWIRSQNDTEFDGQIMSISEVDRLDAGVYTCIAWNVMSPTGEAGVKGESSATFTLKVSYKAEITSFEIYGATGDGPYIYEELSTFAFHCVVDSYPGSNITISKDGRPIESGDRVTELGHTVNKGTCTDSGLYTCVSYNVFNDEVRPKKEIGVIVRFIGSAATKGSPGVYIGVGVTGVIVAVAVIVILVVVVKKRRTSTHGRSSKDVSDGGKQRDRKNSPADSGQMQEYINMDLISEGHGSAQRNEYEDLTTRPRDTNVYDELRGDTGNTDGVTEDKG